MDLRWSCTSGKASGGALRFVCIVRLASCLCAAVGAMDVTKPYKFIWFGAMDVTKPYEFIGFGAMDVTKPYNFIGFGAMDVTKPYNLNGGGSFFL